MLKSPSLWSTCVFCVSADLHTVHGLPELVQLMCRTEGLQADISQLHFLLPELAPQLHYRLRLTVQTFRQSVRRIARLKDFKYSNLSKVWWTCSAHRLSSCECADTYSVLECVFLSMWLVVEVPLWGSLGDEGNDESVISSMSEWEEADLGDFFLANACLKELRNCK